MKQKTRRRLLIGTLVLLALAIAAAAILFGISGWMEARAQERIISLDAANEKRADCILVLGAGVRDDGTPSPLLADRLDRGIELYRQGAAEKLLMSGDHGQKDYDEVNVMKQYAIDRGVPSEDVFMDHAGFSTYESMYRARAVFCVKKLLVVTQSYHLPRALYDASQLGLEAWGIPSDQHQFGGQTYRDLREVLARNKDFLWCLIQPKPTYLGDAIPVTGSGDLTNDSE